MRKLPTSNYYFEYFDCSYPLHVRQLIRPLQTTSQFFLDCLLPIFTGLLFHHCTSIIGMSVRVSDHQRVLHLTRAGLDSCLHPQFEPTPDPHRIGFRFHFSPKGAPETKKTKKRNMKGTQKTPKGTWKYPKPEKNSEINIFTKSNRHLNSTQNPTGSGLGCQISPVGASSGVKFKPTIFFRGSGFRSTRPQTLRKKLKLETQIGDMCKCNRL
jgi:hypothetical protein